ncbi:MAG TPA: hypothetical protein V6C95_13350 [Coleofasciculaceae cyanobacterium]
MLNCATDATETLDVADLHLKRLVAIASKGINPLATDVTYQKSLLIMLTSLLHPFDISKP